MNRFRSLRAIVAGVLAVVMFSVVTDLLRDVVAAIPPAERPMNDSQSLLATAYRLAYGVLGGGSTTARLAPCRPMWHALVIGFIGFAFSVAGVIATWRREAEFGRSLVSCRTRRAGAATILGGCQNPPTTA